MVTRLINMMGAYCFGEGNSIGFNEENPKGFWERRDVIEANDELLTAAGISWDRPAGWQPDKVPEAGKLKYQHRFKQILLNLDANRPWVIKDPRLCLTFPLAKALLEVPVLVYVSRSPFESAASLQTRNDFPIHYGLALWEFYAISALKAGKDVPRVHVFYNDFLTHPLEAVEELYRQLQESGVSGLNMPSNKEIEAFIDPDLWREKTLPSVENAFLTPHQRLVFEMFQGKREVDDLVKPSPITISILEEASAMIERGELSILRQHLKEMGEERDQLGQHLKEMGEERDQLGQHLKEMGEERDQLGQYLKETREERDHLRQRLNEVEAERDHLHQHLEQSREAMHSRRIALDTLMAALGEDAIEDAEEGAKLKQIAASMGALQRHHQLMLQDMVQLENYIFDLERILRAIQGSMTWQQASRAAAWIGRLTGRPPSRIMEDAANVFAAFEHWRRARN